MQGFVEQYACGTAVGIKPLFGLCHLLLQAFVLLLSSFSTASRNAYWQWWEKLLLAYV